jgi:hypothetical protein
MIEHLQKRLEGRDSIPAKIQIQGLGGVGDVQLLAVDEIGAVYVDRNTTVCRPWAQIAALFPEENG